MDQVILLLGPSGSGKGAQAALLAKRLEGKVISTGELLREHAQTSYDIASGDLADSSDITRLLTDALARVPQNQPIIFDGVARMPEEAAWLQAELASRDRRVNLVIELVVPESELIERLHKRLITEGRNDDTMAGIHKRLGWYHDVVQKTLQYWRTQTQVVQVDGSGTPDSVAQRIQEVIDAA